MILLANQQFSLQQEVLQETHVLFCCYCISCLIPYQDINKFTQLVMHIQIVGGQRKVHQSRLNPRFWMLCLSHKGNSLFRWACDETYDGRPCLAMILFLLMSNSLFHSPNCCKTQWHLEKKKKAFGLKSWHLRSWHSSGTSSFLYWYVSFP